MKKFALFLAPLMAISFLTNCGGQSGPKQYSVIIEDHKHLSFTTLDGKKDLSTIKATEGQDFKFKMKVDEESNETAYKLPAQLMIYVGNSKFSLMKDVTITETIPYLEADVVVAANQITGDIKITGSAVPVNYYEIKIFNHGVNVKGEDFNPNFPYAESDKIKEITFLKDGEYDLPGIDDIYLGVDGKNWISPKGSTYCSYDENNHKLTINANKVNSGLAIAVRSPGCNLLESLSWNDIDDCSKSGHAHALFKIGEEKTVNLNGLVHKVRIIDFDRDQLDDSERKAGITFEFYNVICSIDRTEFRCKWDKETNTNFPFSDLNRVLNVKNDCILFKLPTDLKMAIKEVNKKTLVSYDEGKSYTEKSYKTYLFPLSSVELKYQSSEAYSYYSNRGDNTERIKFNINNEASYYWTRSPVANDENKCFYIERSGIYSTSKILEDISIAPAFCI